MWRNRGLSDNIKIVGLYNFFIPTTTHLLYSHDTQMDSTTQVRTKHMDNHIFGAYQQDSIAG